LSDFELVAKPGERKLNTGQAPQYVLFAHLNNAKKGISMAVQQIHTYCAMCVSQCGVVASVEDGILKNVNIDPDHPNG